MRSLIEQKKQINDLNIKKRPKIIDDHNCAVKKNIYRLSLE